MTSGWPLASDCRSSSLTTSTAAPLRRKPIVETGTISRFCNWRQNVLGDYAEPDLATEYLGRRHPLPFMLGPVGFLGLYARNGEQKAASAAHAAGIPFCLLDLLDRVAGRPPAGDRRRIAFSALCARRPRTLRGTSERCGRGRCRGAVRDRRYGHHRHPRTR